MRNNFSVLTPFVIALSLLQTSWANNNHFLPGDAFFPTELTKADVERIQKAKGNINFKYSKLGGYGGAFCGGAGYHKASMPVADDAFAKNLAKAYERIREFEDRELIEFEGEDGKIEYDEINGVKVLFYNSDFDFNKHALGLRYNENWLKEVVAFGHSRDHARLCCLLQSQEAVTTSWRDGDLVPAFKAKTPNADGKSLRETMGEPIVFDTKVKAIVIPASTSLDDLFERSAGSQLLVVDSSGVKEMRIENYKWQEGNIDIGGFGAGKDSKDGEKSKGGGRSNGGVF
ncbi:hypothetical protein [Mariniblastus fucicola]|uniref:Uncharacterized protein n=1 Tax=Mariniblastus fucicola TaxID=980251 RepID=A0A5B9PA88_9BACT|nr:hypothetical protein [Mariniblastus fucicola]QEG22409.1 hypothetical protein MFFC18_22890 [Mariniblastus fucicola]